MKLAIMFSGDSQRALMEIHGHPATISNMTRTRMYLTASATAIAVLTAACGGGSGEDAAAKVASLSGNVTTTTASGGSSQASFQDAMLKYAACMRKNGVPMADPQFDSNGRPTFGAGGAGGGTGTGAAATRRDDPKFQNAQDACRSLMESAQGQFQPDPQQQAETQKNLLAFAKCMRDEGVDYPDPQFDSNGRPIFDRSQDRRMTFNSDDPKIKAASDACQKKLGNTFRPGGGGGAIPGGPPRGGGA